MKNLPFAQKNLTLRAPTCGAQRERGCTFVAKGFSGYFMALSSSEECFSQSARKCVFL
jgi:hypothetical protein